MVIVSGDDKSMNRGSEEEIGKEVVDFYKRRKKSRIW